MDENTYGPLKALCEQAARQRHARPRHRDPAGTHRRARRQHRSIHLLAGARRARRRDASRPGAPTDPFQIIDARDLAAFTLLAVERRVTGTYNLVSNVGDFKFGQLTEACIAAAKRQAKPAQTPRATWIPAEFLEAQQVAPWSEMPAWLPAKGEEAAFAGTSNAAARAKGLSLTPLAKTVDDTLAWHLSRPAAERDQLKAGIAPDKEAAVLAAWKARPPADREELTTRRAGRLSLAVVVNLHLLTAAHHALAQPGEFGDLELAVLAAHQIDQVRGPRVA